MKKFTRALERHRNIVFATTTSHGVGALHYRHKLPPYKLKQVADRLGLKINNEWQHKHHLQFRNGKNELIGTLVNLNLFLMPKYAKIKAESMELAIALLDLIP
ncbi:TPA: hypothetical protein HA244_00790 [Candidatus Micrarchaeota archaeon]|nr:hypothetical protein [Candidatus Micrarchaeota archaeon]